MERCSYFIEDKALFGSFPTQEDVNLLEEHGVRCFVDLTGFHERKTIPYTTKYKYVKYPIIDHKIPKDWKSFAQLILEICQIIRSLENGEKIYLHCKGGHGRSGIAVACVICQFYGFSADDALRITSKCHSRRPEMRDKWRRLGSPQGKRQKDFVRRFFHQLKYGQVYGFGYTIGLSNTSEHSIDIPGMGVFPSAYLAFQAYRDPDNKEYIDQLKNGQFNPDLISRQRSDWEETKGRVMYEIISFKFRQHEILYKNLTNTGLRPLVKATRDSYWGDGGNGQGKNMHGRMLVKLRNTLLLEELHNHQK